MSCWTKYGEQHRFGDFTNSLFISLHISIYVYISYSEFERTPYLTFIAQDLRRLFRDCWVGVASDWLYYFSTYGNIHHNLLQKNTDNFDKHFPVYTHCKHFPDSLLASALIVNLSGCSVPHWGYVFVKAFCFSFARHIFI